MNIIVVEDNSINLAVHKAIVSGIHGADVAGFEDPKAALNHCRQTTYDLVLVDFQMPQINGIDFVRALRAMEDYVHVPIVMITANFENDLRLAAIQAGATDFLTKPVNPDELKLRTKNLLALREAQINLSDRARHLTREVETAAQALMLREEEMIWRLARAIECRDGGTGEHINRVASVCRMIAEEIGLDPEQCREIYLSAPLHDVGKIGVPDAILNKPGRLDETELQTMRDHVEFGAAILSGANSSLLRVASRIAKSHHERWDGQGYPEGLSGTDIPIEGRIAAVADVFDALCTERPYKPAWDIEDARVAINQESGKHFDPDCVSAFERAWPRISSVMTRR